MSKQIAAMVAATMLAALAPLATAGAGDDGNISRTFLYQGGISWKPQSNGVYGGVGWYAPNNPDNLCLISLYGLSFGVGFYYETGRILFGDIANVHGAEVGEIELVAEDAGCPAAINPDGALDSQWIGSSAFNVYVSPSFSQSHLLCSAVSTAVFCNADGDSATWEVRACAAAPNTVDFAQGDFLLLGTPVSIMSSRVNAAGDCPDAVGGSTYDLTGSLNPLDNFQNSFPDIHLNTLAALAPGQSSKYAVSCFSMPYDRISIAGTTPEVASSHDYFLALNNLAGETTAWATYLAHHVGPPTGGPNPDPVVVPAPLSVALNGFYDLNGDNGCPAAFAGVVPLIKIKTDPFIDLNPVVIPECMDGVDNTDDADTDADVNDRGCHSDDNASNIETYRPTDGDECDREPSTDCPP